MSRAASAVRVRLSISFLSTLALLVSACGGGGGSLAGDPAASGPADAEVGVPQDVSLAPTLGGAFLSWTPVQGATGYEAFVSPVGGIDPEAIDLVAGAARVELDAGAMSHGFMGLTPGTVYHAAVRTLAGEARSSLSAEVSVLLAPDAPWIQAAQALDGAIRLVWAPAPSAATYDVYVAADPTITSATWATLPGARHVADARSPLLVDGLSNGTPYTLLVVAANMGGRGPDSAPVTATPEGGTPPVPPAAVTDLQATGGPGEITLTWSTAEQGVSAVLYGALDANVSSSNWADLPGGMRATNVSSPATFGDLENGSTWTFVVVLERDGLTSPDSAPATATASARGTFVPGDTLPTALGASGIAHADFDGDGLTDLVSADYASGTITLFQGVSGGQFGSAAETFIAYGVRDVAAADFDGDGTPDLALIVGPDAELKVLLGDGAFGFSETASLETDTTPERVLVADLDLDGAFDLAVACRGSDTVRLYFGDGAGGFSAADPLDVGSEPRGLAVEDLDGDGNLDIAVACFGDDELTLLYGDGSGGYGSPVTIAVGGQPCDVLVSYLDGDGYADLVATQQADDDVLCLMGNADGGFDEGAAPGVQAGPRSSLVEDFDGDGSADLVVLNHAAGTISVFRGDGEGGFTHRQTLDGLAGLPVRAVATDLDGDGILDLAVALAEGYVTILLGAQ